MYQKHGPYRSIRRWLWPPRRRRDWQRQHDDQMRCQRAWHLFDAACASVRALADHVHAQVSTSGEDAEPLAQELRSIRHTLDEDALACISPSAGEALSALFNLTDKAAGWAGPPADNFASALDALLRALEAQRRALAALVPAWIQGAMPAAGSIIPAAPAALLPSSSQPADEGGVNNLDVPALPPDGSAEDHTLTRGGAAILSGVAENSYKSWPFRIIGFVLVTAAFLAGTGTLFFDELTLSLRQHLEETEKKGEDDIKNSTKTPQEAIDKQMVALSVTNTEIQNEKDDFERQLNAGRERIAAEISDFTSKSDDLQKKIADIVVQRLDTELKIPLSVISAQIKERGDSALFQIDRARGDALDPLITQSKDITARLNQIRDTITGYDNELRMQTPALDRLKGLGAKLDEVSDQLNKIEAREALLADAVTRAGTQANLAASHAEVAKQAAELAADARAKAVSDVGSSNDGTADQERAPGSVGARIDNLNRQIEDFETKLRGGLPVTLDSTALTPVMGPLMARVAELEDRLDHPSPGAAPPDLGALTASVAKLGDPLDHPSPGAAPPDLEALTASVAKLGDRLDRPTPPPSVLSFPVTEAGLPLDQRKQIQKALHLSSGQVHGTFGPNTRRAITAFRKSTKSTTTGDLTADEIKQLLSPTP